MRDDALHGLAAVVTGAGRGLGRSVAHQLAARGAAVVIVAEIRELHGPAIAAFADVSELQASARVIEAAITDWGRLDIFVNCAGNFVSDTLTSLSEESLTSVLRVHTNGTLFTSHHAPRHWAARPGFGRLVNVTSEAAMAAVRDTVSYAAAKGAALAGTRAAALELAELGVTANCVTQGSRTRMREAYHVGRAEPVADRESPMVSARLIGWLASPSTGHVTGQAFGFYGDRFVAWGLTTHDLLRSLEFETCLGLRDDELTLALSPST